MKGRNIGDNLRLMSDVFYFAEKETTPGIIMNRDCSNAIDFVERAFLFRALKTFSFGESNKLGEASLRPPRTDYSE